MKLDMDLVRDLLLQIEGLKPYQEILQINTDNLIEAEHLELLIESGLCKGNINYLSNSIPMGHINRLTWEGHQFLETIRDDKVWRNTKSILIKAGSFTLDLIQKVAVDIITKQISSL